MSSSIRCSNSTILVLMDESFFISGVTLLVRRASSSSSLTLRRRRRRIARRSSSCSFLVLAWRRSSQSWRLRNSIFRTDARFIGMRCPIVPLSAIALVGADLHRAVERQIAVVHLLKNFHRRLKAVIALQHLGAENLAGDLDLLGQGDFLLARQQGDFAHLRQVHPHRIVDPLGRSLRKLRFEVQIQRFVVVVILDGILLGDPLGFGRPSALASFPTLSPTFSTFDSSRTTTFA